MRQFFVCLFLIAFGLIVVFAQQLERPRSEQPTKQWHVAMLPTVDAGYRPQRVDVIDTAGVCLYVVRQWNGGEGVSPAIAAVPKTQLPPGTGCQ